MPEKDKGPDRQQSAIPPGRMRQTDKVKGRDCPIPNQPGVYRHVEKMTGKVVYSGQTDRLRQRQQQHLRDGRLDLQTQIVAFAVAREGSSKAQLLITEKRHIERHQPEGNKCRGGNGRRTRP